MSCLNCGSQNHESFDCSKPYSGWREREAAKPKPAIVAEKPAQVLEPLSVSIDKMRVTQRPDFPFLRKVTRRGIDERIKQMTTASATQPHELPKQEERKAPVALPREQKEKLLL